MKGPFIFKESYIDTIVLGKPGVYIFVNVSNKAVYVGRADSDLNRRLKEHLPQNEENVCIKRSGVNAFYIEYAEPLKEAYILECNWYHKYRPTCNSAHPARSAPELNCPVCGL